MNSQKSITKYNIIEFICISENTPQRLDKYIGHHEEFNLTRNKAQKLIEDGLVTVDGKKALHHQILKGGEKIVISIPPSEPTNVVAENIPLKIVYEDEFLLVVDKPAGMVTHPASGNYKGTLVNALMNYSQNLSHVQFDRPGIVHRLDKDTTGLLIVAKNDDIHLKLQTALRERKIRKTYIALVCGHMKENKGLIELPVGRSLRNRNRMAVTRLKGREAVTEYKLLDRYKLYDLLEIILHTGRTHQIRVHLSHLGHPVFGDPEYGGQLKWHKGIFSLDKRLALRALDIMPRQALHAKGLEFTHPASGEIIILESELPRDFSDLMALIEKEGR
jgi:23S rRNA pseudouridine1911/1915/1917 synthase